MPRTEISMFSKPSRTPQPSSEAFNGIYLDGMTWQLLLSPGITVELFIFAETSRCLSLQHLSAVHHDKSARFQPRAAIGQKPTAAISPAPSINSASASIARRTRSPHTVSIMAPPFFSDIAKDINGLLNRDFYHSTPAALDVKTSAPNGVGFTVKGKTSPKDGSVAANVEARVADKATGLTLTQGWSSANVLDTKVELANLTPGLRSELVTSCVPGTSNAAKLNLSFVQPAFTARGFFDLLKGPSFVGDLTLAHEGFVGGAEVGYDIAAATVSRYAVALGYRTGLYSVALGVNNAQITTASFFQRVNPALEVGAKAALNPAAGSKVNIEFATRYALDLTAQVKAKIADSGLVALSYKQLLRPGVELGVGASFDALKLAEPVHKLGWSLSFSA
ncbi:ADL247Cp [Eremothecium gossypii ATCC 10895]|uniref:ADL247Cp n=1 Tax=Eremothecium gossypii (strain ATCC 10895 / CBS 109.51 / FGSC 9923 / NRRL Y-1056) TaxID=284811 RepID=Q75B24_EREGS|nr:ADL247Cp [Eremothecium gossypii ATCC 10895]AAS51673.2 ADL247Cp [Eremothecium gossypii ATCC 10895]AEY95970.1 FADL247Cp [Eremothecium gossypii FDAG1]